MFVYKDVVLEQHVLMSRALQLYKNDDPSAMILVEDSILIEN